MTTVDDQVPGGCILIRAPFTSEQLVLLLDEASPEPTGGFGGFDQIVIPRKRAVRFFSAVPDDGFNVQVIFLPDGSSVATQIRILRSIGIATEDRRPRQVELAGQLPPLPSKRWVIDDVTWGDSLYTPSGKTLLEQRATITFGLPPDLDALTVSKGGRSKYRTRNGKRAKHPTAALLGGESLQEFCARTLGNPSRWGEVARLQKPPIKDPRKPGKAGRRLKLPAS